MHGKNDGGCDGEKGVEEFILRRSLQRAVGDAIIRIR